MDLRALRGISLLLSAILLLNLMTFSVAQAGGRRYSECGEDCHSHRHLPEDAINWCRKDFSRWLQSASVSERARSMFQAMLDSAELVPVVVTKSAYSDWFSSLDPAMAEKVERSVVRISGSALPSAIVLRDTKGLTAEIEPESEYVIMASAWCTICKAFVMIILGWALGRWLFDPTADWVELHWEEITEWICGHFSDRTEAQDTSVCPYQPWCGGTWQGVIWDDGVTAELECGCGGLWYSHNPLY